MLVLQREISDTVTIRVPPSAEATTITVMLVGVGPHTRTAKLGFAAPREVAIERDDMVKGGARQATK